jgi:L-2-hydroxyglutarate oxidase LhgO
MGSEAPDVAVIGAGVVGLACAAAIARRGRSVVILERHAGPGRETSSRNSGVIHAGLYYPSGSLKSELCIRGRELLYARCRERGIPHRRTGKLIVAVDAAEVGALEAIRARAEAAGAGALTELDGAGVRRLEPNVRAAAGLLSPASGIVDVHALMGSYLAEASSHGATLALRTEVTGLARKGQQWEVETASAGGDRFRLRVLFVINAAGLEADRIAALAGLDVDALGYRQRPCKGDYFSISIRNGSSALTERLVYPVPSGAGLGIHVTMDLGGRYTLGPDAEYVDAPRYDVDPAKAALFGAAARRYLPALTDDLLAPDRSGVRPKLAGPGEGFRDFVIEEASAHGAPGLVNLLGIESPGLTASEAIGERVAELIDSRGGRGCL